RGMTAVTPCFTAALPEASLTSKSTERAKAGARRPKRRAGTRGGRRRWIKGVRLPRDGSVHAQRRGLGGPGIDEMESRRARSRGRQAVLDVADFQAADVGAVGAQAQGLALDA